jgi:hypothetical protein
VLFTNLIRRVPILHIIMIFLTWHIYASVIRKITFLESKVRPVHKADKLAVICEPIQSGILNISEPYKPPRLATGIALFFHFFNHTVH